MFPEYQNKNYELIGSKFVSPDIWPLESAIKTGFNYLIFFNIRGKLSIIKSDSYDCLTELRNTCTMHVYDLLQIILDFVMKTDR